MDFFTSKCCRTEAIIQFSDIPDFIGDDPKKQRVGTNYFVCTKCKKPCDILPLEETINPNRKEEDDFKWSLSITRVDNGYLLEGLSDVGNPTKIVIEDSEKDELKSHESLLWNIMEYFNFQGSRYDKERIKIIRKQGDKYHGEKKKK